MRTKPHFMIWRIVPVKSVRSSEISPTPLFFWVMASTSRHDGLTGRSLLPRCFRQLSSCNCS